MGLLRFTLGHHGTVLRCRVPTSISSGFPAPSLVIPHIHPVNTQVRAPPFMPAPPKLFHEAGTHLSQGLCTGYSFCLDCPFLRYTPGFLSQPPSGLCCNVPFPEKPPLATQFKGRMTHPSHSHPLPISLSSLFISIALITV